MSYQPLSRPYSFIVAKGFGDYATSLKTKERFETGDMLAPITGIPSVARNYATLQCGPADHDNLQLDSDLIYTNHSCDPNTVWDMSSDNPSEWHVRATRTIAEGDEITFFYPSTEWEMSQPFACHCGAGVRNLSQRLSQTLTRMSVMPRGYQGRHRSVA
ncbi:hypothetical protein BDW22DRAFT_1356694 [Trametopsis cervina]|nr:hypothetical protein BDW22DRAFT_1356694 [Trametopsis cervina]